MKVAKVYGTRPANHPFPVISWLIRLMEWSKISHVGIYFTEEDEVFGAHFNDLEFVKRDKYTEVNRVVYEITIPFTNSEYDALRKNCETLEGKQKGYWLTLFGALVPQLFRTLFNKLIKHPCPKGYTCSWMVLKLFTDLGYKYEGKVDPPNFTTTDAIEFSVEMTKNIPKSRFHQLK